MRFKEWLIEEAARRQKDDIIRCNWQPWHGHEYKYTPLASKEVSDIELAFDLKRPRQPGRYTKIPQINMELHRVGYQNAAIEGINANYVLIKPTSNPTENIDLNPFFTIKLQKKADDAGEIDWRPTETIPDDYYMF